MNTGSKVLIVALICAATSLLGPYAIAQPAEEKSPPKTKLESFQRQTGSVLIKGYTEIGTIASAAPSLASLQVRSMEFVNPVSKQKQTGIAIERTSFNSRMDVLGTAIAFVDYDEIDDLLKGIDYVSKTTADVTKHSSFEVKYETRGGFAVTIFNESKGKVQAAIDIGTRSVHISLEEFSKFRSIIVQAREKIDALR